MKITDIEGFEILATKADIQRLEDKIERLNERMFEFQSNVYRMIVGVYALVVIQVMANHFWK
jgi:hypothetical protein